LCELLFAVDEQPLTPIAAAVATASTATVRSRRERMILIGVCLSFVDGVYESHRFDRQ